MLVIKMSRRVFLLLFVIHYAQAEPCDTAELRDADLRSSANTYNPASTTTRFCDITLTQGWYRFQTNGVNADMPTSEPEFRACNTLFPGYLIGKLPTTLGKEVSLDVCIRNHLDGVCANNIPVKVKNCGTYNVYYLKPVQSCPTAYCFDTGLPCPDGESSETGTQPCTANFPLFTAIPVVKPLLGTSGMNDIEDLRFECQFPTKSTELYDIIWFVNDVEVHRYTTLPATSIPQGGQLLESHWTKQFRMGMNVKCAVKARYTSSHGAPSPEHPSPVFFAGIKVLGNTAIELEEKEHTTVQFQATVPIPCYKTQTFCVLEVRVQKIGEDCKGIISDCKINIKYTEWNTVNELTVKGVYNSGYEDQVAQLILIAQPYLAGIPSVWDGVETTPIEVNVHDTDAEVAGSRCSISNDPHLVTFDNKPFDVHLHGEFILYKHKTLPYEVRGFFQHCNTGSIAHCVCGAAVRSGSQYFVWSKCTDNLTFRTSRINVYGCTSRQLSVTTDKNKFIYTVRLPSGLEVTIDTRSKSILITPSAADIGQTVGLCGNFNGNPDDEFIDPNGNLYNNGNQPTYSIKWKITDSVQSFYNGLAGSTLYSGPLLTAHCRCEAGEVICENKPRHGCEAGLSPDDVTDQYCTQLNKRRRKRQVGNEALDEPIPVFPLGPEKPSPKLDLNNIWRNGWTEARAERHCRAVFSASKAVQACNNVRNLKKEIMIKSCVADIALTGTSDWAIVSVDAYKVQCLAEVAKNASLWKDNTGTGQTVLQDILSNLCPGECSGNGACNRGICSCTNPWIGPDCGVDGSRAANVTELESGGLCDLSQEDCRQVLVRGEEFVDSESLRCRFTQVSLHDGAQPIGTVYTSKPVFRHSSEVLCSLPDSVILISSQPYLVSVSNNNNDFGSGEMYLPFDSTCHNCGFTGTDAWCKLNSDYCFLNNTCVNVGQQSSHGTCVKGMWTRWFNRDRPSGNGDYENLIYLKPPPCGGMDPVRAEVRLSSILATVLSTEERRTFQPGDGAVTQTVQAGPTFGFQCVNKNQLANVRCVDYQVRFLCPNYVM